MKGKKQNQPEQRVQNMKEDNYVICVFMLFSHVDFPRIFMTAKFYKHWIGSEIVPCI